MSKKMGKLFRPAHGEQERRHEISHGVICMKNTMTAQKERILSTQIY